MKITNKQKDEWIRWMDNYGTRKFLEAFLRNVENAESTCAYCNRTIYVDVMIGGGVPDWSTLDGDFGCAKSPDTTPEGTGGHMPRKREYV